MYKSGSRQNLGVAGITTVRNGWLRRRKRDHLAKVLQGDEFEVEPQDGHTFEEATLCKGKLFSIRSSYVAAFAVAAVELPRALRLKQRTENINLFGDHQDSRGNTLRVVAKSRTHNEKLEYQIVYTRLNIASADVGMLDKFDHRLQTDVQATKEAIWLKGLAIESGLMLKIVAVIAIGALSKAIPSPRFQHRLNLLSIDIGYLSNKCGNCYI
ncbi:hypothetical protein Tco_0805626 [Tanacetum coccineum]